MSEPVGVGDVVGTAAVDATGLPAHAGLVVDEGVDERGERYFVVLDERAVTVQLMSGKQGSKHLRRHRPAHLRRIYVADVGEVIRRGYGVHDLGHLHAWARKAWHGAALGVAGTGNGDVGDSDLAVVRYGLELVALSGATAAR